MSCSAITARRSIRFPRYSAIDNKTVLKLSFFPFLCFSEEIAQVLSTVWGDSLTLLFIGFVLIRVNSWIVCFC
jgi:hypothetical protein